MEDLASRKESLLNSLGNTHTLRLLLEKSGLLSSVLSQQYNIHLKFIQPHSKTNNSRVITVRFNNMILVQGPWISMETFLSSIHQDTNSWIEWANSISSTSPAAASTTPKTNNDDINKKQYILEICADPDYIVESLASNVINKYSKMHKNAGNRTLSDFLNEMQFSGSNIVMQIDDNGNNNDDIEKQNNIKPESKSLKHPGRPSSREYLILIVIGVVLSFTSGCVNGAALSSILDPFAVSHMTGLVSQGATMLGQGASFLVFFEIFFIYLCYLVGSFVSGLFLSPSWSFNTRKFDLARTRYDFIFLLQLGALIGSFYTFGAVDSDSDTSVVIIAFSLSSLSCGLQNGAISNFSKGFIRTTHVTGTTTDLGLFCGQAIRFWVSKRFSKRMIMKQQEHLAHMWKLKMLAALLLAFFTGSFCGAFIHKVIGNKVFLIPISLTAIELCIVVFMTHSLPK